MKQLEIKTNKRLLIVEAISKGIADAWVFNTYGLKTMMNSVCEGSEFTEEKARLYLTPTNRIYSPKGWELWFRDFIDGTKHKTSALESFVSAIEASGYHWGENPLGKKPELSDARYDKERKFIEKNPDEMVFGDHYADWSMWQEAESSTFNPSKCIIFEIL